MQQLQFYRKGKESDFEDRICVFMVQETETYLDRKMGTVKPREIEFFIFKVSELEPINSVQALICLRGAPLISWIWNYFVPIANYILFDVNIQSLFCKDHRKSLFTKIALYWFSIIIVTKIMDYLLRSLSRKKTTLFFKHTAGWRIIQFRGIGRHR